MEHRLRQLNNLLNSGTVAGRNGLPVWGQRTIANRGSSQPNVSAVISSTSFMSVPEDVFIESAGAVSGYGQEAGCAWAEPLKTG
jgi:hypothetical protein